MTLPPFGNGCGVLKCEEKVNIKGPSLGLVMDFFFICSQNSMFTYGPPHLLEMGVGCKN